jgi:pimeloyl-ACP methyl ester carboxylesterase
MEIKRHSGKLLKTILTVFFIILISFNPINAQIIGEKETGKSNIPELLTYKDKNGVSKPVLKKPEWEQRRRQILDSMQMVMGKLPDRTDLPLLNMKVIESLKGDNYTRLTINFTVAENESASAYLYLPFSKNNRKKLPAMVVLHGTGDEGKQLVDGASPLANRAIAKELAKRGYVVIAPDYPSFGDQKEYDFDSDRYESGTMKAIFNHIRCVDLLQVRKEVDPDRIGVIGHSLGGHNAMFVGAFDKRIKVVVSSCGWTLFDCYNAGEEATKKYGGRLGPWAQKRYMPLMRDKYNLDAAKIPFDFDEVIAAIAPRPFFSNSPVNDANFDVNGVKEGIVSATKVYRFLKADENLQVRYPDAKHDFPPEIRLEAYRFVDRILKHTPSLDKIE